MFNEYEEENKLLLKSFLDRTFFKAWKDSNGEKTNYYNLELQINSICDNRCSYCYYKKYNKLLNPFNKKSDEDKILKNLDIFLDFLEKEKMHPKIEIFSGETFSQEIGFLVTEKVIDWQIKNKIKNNLVIPTNGSFLCDEEKTKRIENLIKKCRYKGFNLLLSFSIDGKYLDLINRPNKDHNYSDEFYNKSFLFAKKHGFSFHPMVHWKGIENWWNNFLWFQEMFKKFDIPWYSIYLLEVRNDGWNKKSVKQYCDFLYKVLDWMNGMVRISTVFYNQIVSMNLLSPFSKCGRGMGCSIQSSMQLRLGDLMITPCHRTSYDYLNIGQFITKNEKIVDIKPLNVPLYMSINSSNIINMPKCQDCLINTMCSGGCLGSQLETNGDLFTPIESVCLLEHGKIYTLIKWLKDNDQLNIVCNLINENKLKTINIIKEWL